MAIFSRYLWVLLCLVVQPAAPKSTLEGLQAGDAVPGRYLVGLRKGNTAASDKSRTTQISKILSSPGVLSASIVSQGSGVALVEVSAGKSSKGAALALASNPEVSFVEPDTVVELLTAGSTLPDDPLFSTQWGMEKIGMPKSWSTSVGSESTIVCVIDTGIDSEHPDLIDNLWVNAAEYFGDPEVDDDNNGYIDDIHGWNMSPDETTLIPSNDANIADMEGHGTHVSGILGAVGNNSVGVAGVNWEVGIMTCRIFNANGDATLSSLIGCMEYCRVNHAPIVSGSYGGPGFSQAESMMIDLAAEEIDQLYIVAAGNENADNDVTPTYPACYPQQNVLSVASSGETDLASTFTNYGQWSVDLAAPGEDIISTSPGGGYIANSGTSMACPHVSGAAALLKAINPGLGAVAMKHMLMGWGDELPNLSNLMVSGKRLNVLRAVENIDLPTPAPPAPPLTAYAPYQWFPFGVSSFDLEAMTIVLKFRDDANGEGLPGYTACYSKKVKSWPVSPEDGTELFESGIPDDGSETVQFPDGFPAKFFGRRQSAVSVSTNGVLSFGSSSTEWQANPITHYARSQISALFTDMTPQPSGSRLSWKLAEDNKLFVVTFENFLQWGAENADKKQNFQIALHKNGNIFLTYLTVQTTATVIIGVSNGQLPLARAENFWYDFSSWCHGPPRSPPPSASCCELLTFANLHGSRRVCGDTRWEGQNCGRDTWDGTEARCERIGARLCTLADLRRGETRGTAPECGKDSKMTWTSDRCGDGKFIRANGGDGSSPDCADSSKKAGVQCCADSCAPFLTCSSADPIVMSQGLVTCGSDSPQGLSCPADYYYRNIPTDEEVEVTCVPDADS